MMLNIFCSNLIYLIATSKILVKAQCFQKICLFLTARHMRPAGRRLITPMLCELWYLCVVHWFVPSFVVLLACWKSGILVLHVVNCYICFKCFVCVRSACKGILSFGIWFFI